MSTGLPDNKRLLGIFLIFLITAVAVFANSLSGKFILDDTPVIAGSHLIKSLNFVPVMFTRPFMGSYYRPLVSVSFALNYLFGGLDPAVFRLTNVFLHALCAFLFFLLFFMLFEDLRISFFAALLFVVHPLVNVNVNYISDRGNLLGALFMLCALLSFTFAYKKEKYIWNVPGALFCVMALLSRESAVLLPGYLLICLFAAKIKFDRQNGLPQLGLSTGICVLYYILRKLYFAFPKLFFAGAGDYLSPGNIASFGSVIFKYLCLLLFPGRICFFRRVIPAAGLLQIGFFWGFLAAMLLLWLRTWKRDRLVFFAGAWILLGILPLYPLMFGRPQIGLVMQDSWIYFSLPAMLLILSRGLEALRKHARPGLFYTFLVLLLVYFSAGTVTLNKYWHDSFTYCRYWQKIVPNNMIASWEMAKYYRGKGEYDRSISLYKKAIKENRVEKGGKFYISRKSSDLYAEMGGVYSLKKELPAAVKCYYIALRINPYNYYAQYNLAGALARTQHFAEAEKHYDWAVKINPFSLAARRNLAEVLKTLGRKQEAEEQLQQIKRIEDETGK